MAGRVRTPIASKLLQNPFHQEHYTEMADAVADGSMGIDEALEVLAGIVADLPDSDEVTRLAPLLERTFATIMRDMEDVEVKREIVVGLAAVADKILQEPKRELAHLAHAYQLRRDPILARDLGLRGAKAFGDAWARPYLEDHADDAEVPDIGVLRLLAETALGEDNLASARRRLDQLLEQESDDPQALEYLEAIESRSEDLQREMGELKKSVDESEGDDQALALQELARSAFMLDRDSAEGAEAVLRGIRDHGLRDPDLMNLLAENLWRREQFEDLEEVLSTLIKTLGKPSAGSEEATLLLSSHKQLGRLYRDSLGRPDDASAQIEAALAVDPLDSELMEMVEARYEQSKDAEVFAKSLEQAAKAIAGKDDAREVALLSRLGGLYWKTLARASAAERVYKKLRSLDASLIEPLDFYQDLYIGQKKFDNLFSVFSHKAEILDGDALVNSASEIEALTDHGAASPEKQLEIWKKVIRKVPNHPAAAARYSELLVQLGRWHSVIDFLKTRLKALGDEQVEDKLEILFQIVDIFGSPDKLNMEDMCANTYRDVLELDPLNEPAINALTERYRASGRHKDLARVMLSKAAITEDLEERRALLDEILEISTKKVRDAETALGALEQLHGLDPDDAGIAGKLKAQYRQRKDYPKLFALLQEELATLESDDERKKTLVELAKMAQEKLGDPEETIRLLEEASALDVTDEKIRFRLETIYRKTERWADFARVLQVRLDLTEDAGQRVALLDKIGKVHLEYTADYAEAEKAFLEILDLRPSKILTQSYLEKIYLRTRDWEKLRSLFAADGNWGGYISTLTEYIERVEGGEDTIAILQEIARVQREEQRNVPGERNALRQLLDFAPDPDAELSALARLAEIYRDSSDHLSLEKTLHALIAVTVAPEGRVELLNELADLLVETKAGVGVGALLFENLDPVIACQSAHTMARLRESLDTQDAIEDLRARMTKRLMPELDAETPEGGDAAAASDSERVFLAEQLGSLHLTVMGDAEGGAAFYRQVLELSPGHAGAIEALSTLFEGSERIEELSDLLLSTLEHEATPAGRGVILTRLAELAEEKQGDREQAIGYLMQALEEYPEGTEVYDAIERIQGELGQWEEVADLYLRRIDMADNDAAGDSLRFSLANVYANQLERVDDALDILEALANRSDDSGDTLASPLAGDALLSIEEMFQSEIEQARSGEFLTQYYELREAWDHLVAVLERRFAIEADSAFVRRIATIRDEHGEDQNDAFDALARFLSLEPGQTDAWTRLAELADELSRHQDLFEAYSVALDEDAGGPAIDDEQLENDLLLKMAGLARDQLGELDAAATLFQRYRDREPDDVSVLDALIEIRGAQEDRAGLIALFQQKLLITWEPDAKRLVLQRLCDELELESEREEELIEYYQLLLGIEEENSAVIARLDALYESFGRYEELSLLIRERELPRAEDDATRVDMLTRLAALHWVQLSDPHSAVERLNDALALDPACEPVHELMEEMLDARDGEEDADLRVLIIDSLEPVYADIDAHKRLVRLLTMKADAADDLFEKAMLQDRSAAIFEQSLDSADHGLDLRLRALANHPTGERLKEVYNRAGVLGQWEKLAGALREVLETPGILDADAAFLLGEVYLAQLENPQEAALWFERVREEEPTNEKAWERLRGIYEDQGDHAHEIEMLMGLADMVADVPRRRELNLKIAEIEWGDEHVEEAEAAYLQVLELGDLRSDETATHAYDRLRELYRASGRLEQLVDVLRERYVSLGEEAGQDGTRREGLYEIAELQRELGAAGEAVDTYRELLLEDSKDPVARNSIEAIYFEAEQWPEYESFLREQLDDAADDELATVLRKLENFYLYYGDDPREAFNTCERILTLEPDDEETVEALYGLLENEDVRADVFRFLASFARERGDDELLERTERRALESFSDEDFDRGAVLSDLARLNRDVFKRDAEAADFAARAWRLDLANDEAFDTALDIARGLGSFEAILGEIDDAIAATSEADPELAVSILLQKAMLHYADLEDREGAGATYEAALSLDPDHEGALDGLIEILRDGDDPERLINRLEARLALTSEVADRVALRKEIGSVHLGQLDDAEAAVTAYHGALEEDSTDEELHDLVAGLYNQIDKRDEALDVLRQKIERFSGDDAHDREIQHQLLGQLMASEEREDEAKDTAIALLERFGFDETAVAYLEDEIARGAALEFLVSVLERILTEAGHQQRLALIYEEALQRIDDVSVKESWLGTLRDLYEGELETPAAALRCQLELIRLDVTTYDPSLYDRATEIAGAAEAYDELVLFLQDLLSELEDQPFLTDIAMRVARTYHDNMNDPDSAIPYLRLVLEQEPSRQSAFDAILGIYKAQESWPELALAHESFSEALTLVDEKVAHLREAFSIAIDRLDDVDMGRSLLRQIVELTPANLEAVDQLEQLYRDAEDWTSLLWLYPFVIDQTDEPERRADLRCRYSSLLVEQQEEYLEGIGQVEDALMDMPGHVQATRLLEDVIDREYLPRANKTRILQRAIELLEGIYDGETDPERRILLTEKKLSLSEDPDEQIELLSDITRLHLVGTADPLRAFDAATRALKARPGDDRLHNQVYELCEEHDLLENLDMVYSDLLSENDDDAILDVYLRRSGDLLRGALDRPDDAAKQLSIFNMRSPGDIEILEWLETYYRNAEDHAKLLGVLKDRVGFSADEEEKATLLLETIALLEEHFETDEQLVDAYRASLELPMNLQVDSEGTAGKLEALLLSQKNYEPLIRFYEARLAETDDPERRITYLKKDAQLRETTLDQQDEAIGLLEQILDIDESNGYALSSLERIYGAQEDHDGLARILGMRRDATSDDEKLVALDIRLADLQLHELSNPAMALRHVRDVTARRPDSEEALDLLHELLGHEDTDVEAFALLQATYEGLEDYARLEELFTASYESSDDEARKAALAVQLSELAALHLGDAAKALVHLCKALQHDPEAIELREKVQILVDENALYEQASALLPETVNELADELLRGETARDFGAFFAGTDEHAATAVELYEIARAALPDDEAVLIDLATLYENADVQDRATELWERLGESAELDISRSYRLRLAEARLEDDAQLALGVDALIDLYGDGVEPERVAALLSQVVDRLEEPGDVLDLLEGHYRERGEAQELVAVLQVRLSLQEDASDQAAFSREIGTLYRDELAQDEMAYEFLARAAMLDRSLLELLPELNELAARCGQEPALAELLDDWAEAERDQDETTREDILRLLLALYEGPLAKPEETRRVLGLLVELVPHDVEMVDRLLALLDESGDIAAWIERAWLRVDQEADPDDRITLLRALAAKASDSDDNKSEIRALEALLDADALDTEAQTRLETLYETAGQQDRVILMLEKRLSNADDPTEVLNGSIQLAELKLAQDPEDSAVITLLERALEVEPSNERALLLLADVFRSGDYHHQLVDVLRRFVDATDDPESQVDFLQEMAQITAGALDDARGAARIYEQLVTIAPDHEASARELVSLYEGLEMPEALLPALNRLLQFEHDRSLQLAVLIRAARVQAFDLGDIAHASERLENVLEQDPYFSEALALQAELAERGGDPAAARAAYERLLESELDEPTTVRVLRSLAKLLLDAEEIEEARERLLFLLSLAPDDAEALGRLVDVYERMETWDDLVELMERKADRATDDEERAGWYRRIASIHLGELDDEEGFEKWIRKAHDAKRDAAETVSMMIDFYRSRERRDDLLPLLEWYVSYLEMKKDIEPFARFAGELAEELLEAGEFDKAIDYRRSVKKMAPQNYENLLGLGRLFYEKGAHDEAQKTFQMMLLKQHQIQDPQTKSEMYLHLARIAAQQGNAKKALQYVSRVLTATPDHVEALELKEALS